MQYLLHRLFGNITNAKADYSNVPTVVFSHPVISTIGLTEREAIEKYPNQHENKIQVFTSTFPNLFYAPFYHGNFEKEDHIPMTKIKLICLGEKQTIIGLHCIGKSCDELMQGFAVAIKMNATKKDFDNCIAIHPTAAEEIVTFSPWGK